MFRTAEINGANGRWRFNRAGLTIMDELATKHFPGYGTNGPASPIRRKKRAARQGPIFGMAMLFVFHGARGAIRELGRAFLVLLRLPIGVLGRVPRCQSGWDSKTTCYVQVSVSSR
jgi:hypothetical protein